MSQASEKAGYHYLASPYTHPDPVVREMRYLYTAEVLQYLLNNRIWAYSPIVHCHELAKLWGLPHDAKFWEEYDFAMIDGSKGVWVLTLEGWQDSKGIAAEVLRAASKNLPVGYVSPVRRNLEEFVKGFK